MEQAIGSGVGAGIGLIALLAAALYHAKLQRRRDRELRSEEARSIASSLFADFEGALHEMMNRHNTLSIVHAEDPGVNYPFELRLSLPPMIVAGTSDRHLEYLPHEAARKVVLAVRSYGMADMLLRLAANEAATGNLTSELVQRRKHFVKAFMQNIHAAMLELSEIAGLADALEENEEFFRSFIGPDRS